VPIRNKIKQNVHVWKSYFSQNVGWLEAAVKSISTYGTIDLQRTLQLFTMSLQIISHRLPNSQRGGRAVVLISKKDGPSRHLRFRAA